MVRSTEGRRCPSWMMRQLARVSFTRQYLLYPMKSILYDALETRIEIGRA
jgi:hypothetical protein